MASKLKQLEDMGFVKVKDFKQETLDSRRKNITVTVLKHPKFDIEYHICLDWSMKDIILNILHNVWLKGNDWGYNNCQFNIRDALGIKRQ